MNEIAAEKVESEKLSAVVTVVAFLVSMFVAAGLIFVDIASAQQVRRSKRAVTDVPASGTLRGQSALDESEWVAQADQDVQTVLFSVAPAGQTGDVEFWRDVASRSKEASPRTQFVGLCGADSTCSLPPRPVGNLTLLSSMDPLQVRAVAVAARQELIHIHRGLHAKRLIPLQSDRSALAARIIGLSREQLKAGAE
jgi:hypothetical protein